MAIKTFYFKNVVPTGATLHRSLQDGGTAPTAATTTTGWVNGTNAAGQSCIQTGGTEYSRTGGNWGTTLQPSAAPSQTIGDCWRSESVLSGTFANSNWTFNFRVRSVTAAYTGRFRLAVRLWASTDANGTGARELTPGRVTSAATTASLTTTADTSVLITWTPGSTEPLSGEYLFVQVGVEITTAGGGNTQDVDFRVGSTATVVTPDFVLSQALSTSLLTNANTLYAPQVAAGPVALSPGLLSNVSQLFAPTVAIAAPSQSLSPGLLSNASTIHTPTVAPGAVTVSPSLLAGGGAVFAPSVSPGAVTIAPGLLASTGTLYAATVSPGAVDIQPPLLSGAQTFYAPTVSQGGGQQSVAPGVVHINSQQFFAPVVAPQPVGLLAPLLTNAQQFHGPTVSIGPVQLAPPLLVGGAFFYTATVSPGAVTLAPILLGSAAAIHAPALRQFNEVATPLLINSSELFSPTISPGSVNLQPPLLLNEGQAFAPVVDSGVYLLTSAQAQALHQVYLLHGLKLGSPLTVSQTQRLAGGLEQAITDGGGSLTITTTAAPHGTGLDVGAMVEELAQWYGLSAPITITSTSQIGGLVNLALTTEVSVTTVARQ